MFQMSRLFGRALVCASALGALVTTPVIAHAQGDATWQSVKKAGVLRCGIATSPPYTMKDPKTNTYSGVFPDLCRDFAENVYALGLERS